MNSLYLKHTDDVNEAESDVENDEAESEDVKVEGDDDDEEEELEEDSKKPEIKLPKYSEHKEK